MNTKRPQGSKQCANKENHNCVDSDRKAIRSSDKCFLNVERFKFLEGSSSSPPFYEVNLAIAGVLEKAAQVENFHSLFFKFGIR